MTDSQEQERAALERSLDLHPHRGGNGRWLTDADRRGKMSDVEYVLAWLEESLEGVDDHNEARVDVHRHEVELAIEKLHRALVGEEG